MCEYLGINFSFNASKSHIDGMEKKNNKVLTVMDNLRISSNKSGDKWHKDNRYQERKGGSHERHHSHSQ